MFPRLHVLKVWTRRIALAATAFFVVAGGSIIPVTAQAVTAPLSPQAWCALANPPAALDPVRADSVMSGVVNLGKFGTYRLADDPDWSDQSSTDLAGNRSINSLEWLMPVVDEGVLRGSEKMLARARFLIYDWATEHPVTRPFGDTDQPLISGKRMVALNCAATALDDPVIRGIAAAEAARMEVMQSSWGAPNNTDLVGFTGLLFNACFAGDDQQRARAEAGLNRVAKALVNKDGSDIEGSPSYANYTAQLMGDSIKIMNACNVNSEIVTTRRDALQNFVAYTIRPNFLWDTIGDSTTERLTTFSNPLGTPLNWAASKGSSGVAPANLYSLFPDGGYLFARSAWSADATYYSLRATPRGMSSPHAHNDSTSLTFYSQGVQWIADPGPYRYDKSLIRDGITKRAAHAALALEGVKTVRKGGFIKSSTSTVGDETCVRDDSYPNVTMIRCVEYQRATDLLIVKDRLIDKRKAKSPNITWVQRWQVPSGISVSPLTSQNGFQLTSGQSALQIVTDAGAKLALAPGGTQGAVGLFTTKYGELAPGNTITRKFVSKGKSDVTVVTTLVRGTEVPTLTSPTAP